MLVLLRFALTIDNQLQSLSKTYGIKLLRALKESVSSYYLHAQGFQDLKSNGRCVVDFPLNKIVGP